MSDIMKRLRAEEQRLGFMSATTQRLLGEAADEIERLRARVDALRWPLAVYIHAHASGSNVPPHIEAAARAALEAKP